MYNGLTFAFHFYSTLPLLCALLGRLKLIRTCLDFGILASQGPLQPIAIFQECTRTAGSSRVVTAASRRHGVVKSINQYQPFCLEDSLCVG